MDFIETLLEVRPRRRVKVRPDERPCVVVASDAQVEPGSLPGGGVLIEDPYTASKQAGWVTFIERMLQIWDLDLAGLAAGRQLIALCEAAMIPIALLTWPHVFRGRSVAWYVDNTSAMHSFVKGAASDVHLERIVTSMWIIAFHLETDIWFEWVDSGSNWADDLSRHLDRCEFSRSLGFRPVQIDDPFFRWHLAWIDLWNELRGLTKE